MDLYDHKLALIEENAHRLGLTNKIETMRLDASQVHETFDPDSFDKVLEKIQEDKIPTASAEITMIPQNYVELTDEGAVKNLERILDLLDEDDDVQAVYHNWDE